MTIVTILVGKCIKYQSCLAPSAVRCSAPNGLFLDVQMREGMGSREVALADVFGWVYYLQQSA